MSKETIVRLFEFVTGKPRTVLAQEFGFHLFCTRSKWLAYWYTLIGKRAGKKTVTFTDEQEKRG